jgi:hypothetical protein
MQDSLRILKAGAISTGLILALASSSLMQYKQVNLVSDVQAVAPASASI